MKKLHHHSLLARITASLTFIAGAGYSQSTASERDVANTINPALPPAGLEQAVAWPAPFPCRVEPKPEENLWIMTLGEVDTPLAEAVFDPSSDTVTLNNGDVIKNYYKEKLEVPYYQAMDKSRYPLPPSGWCSWYFYYADLTPKEFMYNAEAMADKLYSWGATICQTDDAWQDQSTRAKRDWSTVDEKWKEPGMAALANTIKDLGLTPGIWIAPHGQSNEEEVKKAGVFMLDENGKSLSESWEGPFLLDPTKDGAHDYLHDLFTKLHKEWGYNYFKIDGQTVVTKEYSEKKDLLTNPPADTAVMYRETLQTIRKAIGDDSYLLGCWGVPLEGVGIMNGSRTGGDVTYGWPGFFVALDATVNYYFLHNIAWYCDPDVVYLRPPMDKDMIRSWLTLAGLTGQATMTSDRLPDLPEDRLAMFRQVIPAADIRPMDLYKCGREKTVWDLKVNHLDRKYDVVGLFNWDKDTDRDELLTWEKLGYKAEDKFHVYDFWNKEYLGMFDHGLFVNIPSAGVRVLTLVPAKTHPQLVSTSRHISQGWVDLVDYKENAEKLTVSGTSRIPSDEPYTLTFAMPQNEPTYQLADFDIAIPNGSPVKILKSTVNRSQGFATVTVITENDGDFEWTARFKPADDELLNMKASPLAAVNAVFNAEKRELEIIWGHGYRSCYWYLVTLDDKPLGYSCRWSAKIPMDTDYWKVKKVKIETVNQEGGKSKAVTCSIAAQ